jgi:glutamate/tyrosine decarboxylase-like PLP-dependent enzyme
MNVSPPSLTDLLQHLHFLLPSTTPSQTPFAPPTCPPPDLSLSPHLTTGNAFPTSIHLHSLVLHLQSITNHLIPSSLSPNYYAFVTGGVTPAALLADWLVNLHDQNLSVHYPGGGIGTRVEVEALEGLSYLFNLGTEWGVGGGKGEGTFTTGATASNVLGLALGREWVLARATERKGKSMSVGEDGLYESMVAADVSKIQVLSTLPHSSVVKACGVLGLGRGNVISVAKEGMSLEIDIEKVREYAGREGTVSILAVSCGEVNTGLFATGGIELWKELRKICNELGVWIHVDGAFGLFGRLLMDEPGCEELSKGVEGIELADSITGDAHKLLNVPYDCGFFFTRHAELSEKVFTNGGAAYLKSEMDDGIKSPLNLGLENSRRFRALPVYTTLKAYGREGYVDMLRRQVGLCRRVVRWLHRHDGYEVLPIHRDVEEAVRKTFMIVLFRATDEKVNEKLGERINAMGRIFVSGTVWQGQKATRIAVSNWQADVERDGKIIEEVLEELVR